GASSELRNEAIPETSGSGPEAEPPFITPGASPGLSQGRPCAQPAEHIRFLGLAPGCSGLTEPRLAGHSLVSPGSRPGLCTPATEPPLIPRRPSPLDPYHEYGDHRQVPHFVRDTPPDHIRQALMPVRSHRDEVALLTLGGERDLLPRFSRGQHGIRVEA